MYMLDTNILIYLIKERNEILVNRIRKNHKRGISISSIVYSELLYGVEKSLYKDKNRLALEATLAPFQIVPYDEKCSIAFSKIRNYLESRGTVIGPYDMLIAAHSIALDTTLVTNNTNEFKLVPGLKLENWIE